MNEDDQEGMEALSIVAAMGGSADAEWQKTIEGVVDKVVSIRFCAPMAFDTEVALSSEATGFVVDAEKGYDNMQHLEIIMLISLDIF